MLQIKKHILALQVHQHLLHFDTFGVNYISDIM